MNPLIIPAERPTITKPKAIRFLLESFISPPNINPPRTAPVTILCHKVDSLLREKVKVTGLGQAMMKFVYEEK
jgi:hypothetical protein